MNMKGFSYERLTRLANNQPPYRGTLDRFPWAERRYGHKAFIRRQEDGAVVYDIVYGYAWKETVISKEEYEKLKKTPDTSANISARPDVIFGHTIYSKHEKVFHRIGTVRPDNTFEFNGTYYSQGVNIALTNNSAGIFSYVSRRGGLLYQNRYSGTKGMLPIYKGLRVNCDTMRPAKDFEVVLYMVNRKKTKPLIQGYEKFFKVTETMLKSLDSDSFISTAYEVVREHNLSMDKYHERETKQQYLTLAQSLMDTAPLDAYVFYALHDELDMIGWRLKHMATHHGTSTRFGFPAKAPYETYISFRKKLINSIYRANPDVFHEKTYAAGEYFPLSNWKIALRVDGVEVKQY